MWCSGISPVAKGWNTDIRLLAFSYGCAEVTGYKFQVCGCGLIEMAPASITLIWMISPYSRIKYAYVETHNNVGKWTSRK